jgi:hypothetical protein
MAGAHHTVSGEEKHDLLKRALKSPRKVGSSSVGLAAYSGMCSNLFYAPELAPIS